MTISSLFVACTPSYRRTFKSYSAISSALPNTKYRRTAPRYEDIAYARFSIDVAVARHCAGNGIDKLYRHVGTLY